MNKEINIGLFGFGCVGQGLYDALEQSQGITAQIRKIGVKNREKKRTIDASNFSFDNESILNRDDINVAVELVDTAEDGFELVAEAMKRGMSVVTANKKMVAENFPALYELANQNSVSFLYEGACAGSIPVIRNLEEYYDNELLRSVSGIVNGSSNYILSKMEEEHWDYDKAVKEAQDLGFAETDPWLDVAGYDAKYKLVLLAIHAFGAIFEPDDILTLGIQNVSAFDIRYAKEKDMRIKLIAHASKDNGKIKAFVAPKFIKRGTELYNVQNEYNGIEIEGAFSDKQLFVGKGAGSYPTGGAVLSDISALSYNYKYEYKKLNNQKGGRSDHNAEIQKDFTVRLYIRYQDDEELNQLDIHQVVEKYSSPEFQYIVAEVGFESLYSLQGKENKVFVCQLD